MNKSSFPSNGFAGFGTPNGRGVIIGSVKAGQEFFYGPKVTPFFAATEAELKAAIKAAGFTL
jgi:hypothetical protein